MGVMYLLTKCSFDPKKAQNHCKSTLQQGPFKPIKVIVCSPRGTDLPPANMLFSMIKRQSTNNQPELHVSTLKGKLNLRNPYQKPNFDGHNKKKTKTHLGSDKKKASGRDFFRVIVETKTMKPD